MNDTREYLYQTIKTSDSFCVHRAKCVDITLDETENFAPTSTDTPLQLTMKSHAIDSLPSRPFKGFDWSEHADVSRLIDELSGEYEAWYKGTRTGKRIRDPGKIKRHLTHFVLEAQRTYRALPELCMGVHRRNEYYSQGGGRYHPSHLSARVVRHATDFLVSADYFEMPSKGRWHPNEKKRRTTRYRATPRLIDLCDKHGISRYMIVPYGDPEVIIQRDVKRWGQKQGDLINYKDTPFTRRARKNLQKINKFIVSHHVDLDITDDQEEELLLKMLQRDDPRRDKFIDYTKTRLRRIFNNRTFEQGGRFYGGWWEEIFSDYRSLITINSKKTVQFDYSGMHFAIMYANQGMDIPMEDPYVLKEYGEQLRKDVKTAFHIIVNCANRKEAAGAVDGRIKKGELSDELGDGERLIDAFAVAHPLIKDKIASGEGIRGQFKESQIAENVLLKGIDLGLCILPVHDGFVTTAGDEIVLETLMNDAFSEVTGYTAKIKPESFNMSVLPDAGKHEPYWITRPDGTVEKNSPIEGEATSFSQIVTGQDIWNMIVNAEEKKKNKIMREKKWKSAHGQ
jgi:hypothetical protein